MTRRTGSLVWPSRPAGRPCASLAEARLCCAKPPFGSALQAVAPSEDDRLYDRALGRHNAALARLLRAPAPDLAAAAGKLDLILRHQVFELTFAEPCPAALRRDLWRFCPVASRG